jgi:hypothetical protein
MPSPRYQARAGPARTGHHHPQLDRLRQAVPSFHLRECRPRASKPFPFTRLTPLVFLTSRLQILTKEEGGRYTPFVSKYSPQMFFRTADVTCQLTFPPEETDQDKMVMPGDNVEMICDLVHDTPMEVGSRFSLREGGKTIGTGLVAEILVRTPIFLWRPGLQRALTTHILCHRRLPTERVESRPSPSKEFVCTPSLFSICTFRNTKREHSPFSGPAIHLCSHPRKGLALYHDTSHNEDTVRSLICPRLAPSLTDCLTCDRRRLPFSTLPFVANMVG